MKTTLDCILFFSAMAFIVVGTIGLALLFQYIGG